MLSIKDWISFLTSEKNSIGGNVIGFSAFMLAVLAVGVSLTNSASLLSHILTGIFSGALLIIFVYVVGSYGYRAWLAERLLDDILLRSQRDPSTIEEKWQSNLAVGRAEKIARQFGIHRIPK
jgi:Zn-dependent protease with chaperone function